MHSEMNGGLHSVQLCVPFRIFFRPAVGPETATMWWLDPGSAMADTMVDTTIALISQLFQCNWAVGGPGKRDCGRLWELVLFSTSVAQCECSAAFDPGHMTTIQLDRRIRIKCGPPCSKLARWCASSTFRVSVFRPLRWTVDMY